MKKNFDFEARYDASNERFVLSYLDQNDNQKIKAVSPADFYSILVGSEASGRMVPIMKTPNDFVFGVLSPDHFTGDVLFKWDAHLDRFCFNKDRKTERVIFPWPNLLVRVRFSRNVVGQIYAYAYEGQLNDDTTLFKLPLSNVYSNGAICMGGNRVEAKDLTTLNNLVRAAFFNSPFNSDLFNEASEHTTLKKRIESIVKDGFDIKKMTAISTFSKIKKEVK